MLDAALLRGALLVHGKSFGRVRMASPGQIGHVVMVLLLHAALQARIAILLPLAVPPAVIRSYAHSGRAASDL